MSSFVDNIVQLIMNKMKQNIVKNLESDESRLLLSNQIDNKMNKMELTFDERLMSLHDRLLYFAMGLTRNLDDAKDLIQESMLKALLNKDQYTAGTNIKAWMYAIVRNTFINGVRRNSRGQRILENAARQELPVANGRYLQGPLGTYNTREMESRVERLPDPLRTPFKMNFSGFKYQEIADEMGIPIGTVKSRIFQARKQLMVELS